MCKDSLYKRLDILLLIIVQDVVNKKIVDKQMHLSIYIIDVNKVLEVRSYIIKDIKASIILDNNILEVSKNKISLHLYSKQIQISKV